MLQYIKLITFTYLHTINLDDPNTSSELKKDLIKTLPTIVSAVTYKKQNANDRFLLNPFGYVIFFNITLVDDTLNEHYKTEADFNTKKFKIKACAPRLSVDKKPIYKDKDFKTIYAHKSSDIRVWKCLDDNKTISFRLEQEYTSLENTIIKYLLERSEHIIKFVVTLHPINEKNNKQIRFETKPVKLSWEKGKRLPVFVKEKTIKIKKQWCCPSMLKHCYILKISNSLE
ncbi:hypothetical protein CDIK_0376 [Cucumispora dikerogammari]|nr:hypothetical protein CDIK_0376 [Cucumispora dikerogammari]